MEIMSYINIIFFLILNTFIYIIVDKYKKSYLKFLIDVPDKKRKLHNKPTFIIGGVFVAIYLIFYITHNLIFDNNYLLAILISSLAIFLIGVYDDYIQIGPYRKLFFLSLIIFIAVYFDDKLIISNLYFSTFNKTLYLGKYSYFITILCMLLLINSLNLSDGINGLAVGISIIWTVYLIINAQNIILNFLIPFLFLLVILFFNIYKGNFFLGDNGTLILSTLIGLNIILLYNLKLNHDEFRISAENIFILFFIPGVDMFRLFILRLLNKRDPFSGDRNHLHHLLISKFSLKKTLITYFSFMILLLLFDYFKIIASFYLILLAFATYFFLVFALRKI
tara:strand:+ start:1301 stop:2308 length:1008 start_codon:yes stop_codon:yes gene_type:complete